MKHGNRTPAGGPATALVPFDLWGSRAWCNQEVVGESHHLPELQRLFGRLGGRERELECSAFLVPEPGNRFDPAAVAVHIEGRIVGHLPREIAGDYRQCLSELTARGLAARVNARVWGGLETDYETNRAGRPVEKERFTASVTIALAEPHLCTPVNAQPVEPHLLLPDGGAVQISGEDQCMPAIEPFLRPEGESFVYATLHGLTDTGARTAKELVEVRIDGLRVGQLTPKMSADLRPAIRHLDQQGLLTAVKAKIKGNRLKAEVTVHGAKAHELPADWPAGSVKSLQPVAHAPIPPRPTRIRFVPAPGWPPPPEGWEPPSGWMPDPAWPPAPPGWQYWVMD
ncbi:hypothetical protein ACGFIF_24500 [Kribbella sp. NPDC049174]|uniref:hypothetical protein n=1 Tax=Kribbella sp. NPDC049174 TaxID=3364112 RepID=UPI0037233C82